MPMYKITIHSVGGGEFEEIQEFSSYDAACTYAWLTAIDDYESFEGLYGIPGPEDIAEEMGLDSDSDTVSEIYESDRESWLNYTVERVD